MEVLPRSHPLDAYKICFTSLTCHSYSHFSIHNDVRPWFHKGSFERWMQKEDGQGNVQVHRLFVSLDCWHVEFKSRERLWLLILFRPRLQARLQINPKDLNNCGKSLRLVGLPAPHQIFLSRLRSIYRSKRHACIRQMHGYFWECLYAQRREPRAPSESFGCDWREIRDYRDSRNLLPIRFIPRRHDHQQPRHS